ncbi:MAG: hypothetical protein IT378_13680 [Sandaracinaceae bacterium]|nr:hypothetical protein [Sandaracinaceae bacterium]
MPVPHVLAAQGVRRSLSFLLMLLSACGPDGGGGTGSGAGTGAARGSGTATGAGSGGAGGRGGSETGAPQTGAPQTGAPRTGTSRTGTSQTGTEPSGHETGEHPPAAGTCSFGEPRLALASAGPFAIVATQDSFSIAAYAADGASVSLVRVSETEVRPLASAPVRLSLERRGAPALAYANDTLAVAVVDGAQHVELGVLAEGSDGLSLVDVAEGASLRFDPALAPAPSSRWALAWTDERATPMRVRARIVSASGEGAGARDLTPTGGGAAAPRFASGAPELTFIDPRVAISVVYRVVLGSDFGTSEVLRPVGNAAEPPEVAVARVGDTRWVGYTAVGNVAMTAVGLVRGGDQAPPQPIVPGRGYGELHVDAASAGDHAIFVADSPTAAPAESPREIHVRLLRGGALSDPVVVRAEPGASQARIARLPDGRLAVGFRAGEAVRVALGRCTP